MPNYLFTGAYPRVLAGLSQGVNAWLAPAEGDWPPYGSTLEAHPGDGIRTDEPYAHPELEEVAEAEAPVTPAPEPVAEPVALPAEAPAPAPMPEPAHDVMTAEGAPAPAEPTL